MSSPYIDLNRTFVKIPKDHKFNEDDYELASYGYGSIETKKWEDLLIL
jgi:hypothetical protein